MHLCANVLKFMDYADKILLMTDTSFQHHLDNLHHNHQHLLALLSYLQSNDYRFITISPASHQAVNARQQAAFGNSLTDIFGWNRTFQSEKIDSNLFNLMQSANIAIPVENGWKSLLRVSSINNQLFLHSAFPTLANSSVFFGPDTYRFAHAIHNFLITANQPINTAVDIGTGSGAGAILLALALPECDIVSADINNDALELARINVQAEEIENVRLVQSDLLHQLDGNFDLIISNPPYLNDASERAYRHGGGQLGAALSLDIVDAAIQRLNPNGTLLLYTGVAIVDGNDAFLAQAKAKLDLAGFSYQYTEIDPDIFGEELLSQAYSGADRIAAVVLTAAKPA